MQTTEIKPKQSQITNTGGVLVEKTQRRLFQIPTFYFENQPLTQQIL